MDSPLIQMDNMLVHLTNVAIQKQGVTWPLIWLAIKFFLLNFYDPV